MTPDPRYLEGIRLFNAGEFFEAHEVWEDLWQDTSGENRRFYQSLIQAAVSLHHALRGNSAGSIRLYHSAKKYMSAYGDRHHGLDITAFWQAMTQCLTPILQNAGETNTIQEQDLPKIQLSESP